MTPAPGLDRVSTILQLFVTGFDGYVLPPEVAGMLARGLAGVTLFSRNIRDRAQVRDLCGSIRAAARPCGLVPVIAVDQEGGRVQRLKSISDRLPAMREVADPWAAGEVTGRELADLGFNLDFAPVLDVDTNPDNPIIGDRSFSSEPNEAASRAIQFFHGLARHGIAGCGKHFPGHGDASADSHLELPVIDVERETFFRRELHPFASAVGAGFKMLMTAHCLYPAFDKQYPATLSPSFIRPLLRGALGFDGVVISDDLGMKAISDRFSNEDIIVQGVAAGLDLFLSCGTDGQSSRLIEAMCRLVRSGRLDQEAISGSVERVAAFRRCLS